MKKTAFIALMICNTLLASNSYAESWKLAMTYPDTGGTVKKFFFNPDKSIYLLSSGQLFKSTNQGKNWKTEQHFLWSNSIFTDNSNYLFANAKDKSEKLELARLNQDQQSSRWQSLGFDAYVDNLAITKSNTIYAHIIENPTSAHQENEIYRSDDLGEHWQKTDFETISNSDRWYGVSFALDSHENLYAGNMNGLYKYSKEKNSWQRLKTYNFNVLSLDGGIVIDKFDNIFVATHDGKIYKSDNGGNSLALISDFQKPNSIKGMIVDAKGNLYVSTAQDGIYRLAAGASQFTQINAGLPSLLTDKLAMDKKGNLYVTVPNENKIYQLRTVV